MGLAASQARYLSLTARKTNVEYEGQQINQERTSLANQSAGLYNQMLALDVPTPPAASDYTKTYYSFVDPADSSSMTVDQIHIISAGNGKTTASVSTTQKTTVTIANLLSYSNEEYSINKNKADEDGNVDYTINIEGREYTLAGPSSFNGLQDEFQTAYAESGMDADDPPVDEPEADDKYFYFTNSQTGMVHYIPAGDLASLEALYNDPPEDLYNYSTQGATKTEQKTYEDVELISANDGTGRYESMTYTNEKGKKVTVKMTQQTVQDEDGYNAAMETYTAQKAIYDKTIAEIDQKTAIIQQQDKTLELHLDQLDTEQQAIQTEMDAIKKVIDKNIEETFKTFA